MVSFMKMTSRLIWNIEQVDMIVHLKWLGLPTMWEERDIKITKMDYALKLEHKDWFEVAIKTMRAGF